MYKHRNSKCKILQVNAEFSLRCVPCDSCRGRLVTGSAVWVGWSAEECANLRRGFCVQAMRA